MTCEICSRTRPEHREAEASGEVNHKFSEDGRLTPLKREQAAAPGAPMPPSDPVLRLLLIEKGLVTSSELEEMTQRLRSTGMAIVQERQDARHGG